MASSLAKASPTASAPAFSARTASARAELVILEIEAASAAAFSRPGVSPGQSAFRCRSRVSVTREFQSRDGAVPAPHGAGPRRQTLSLGKAPKQGSRGGIVLDQPICASAHQSPSFDVATQGVATVRQSKTSPITRRTRRHGQRLRPPRRPRRVLPLGAEWRSPRGVDLDPVEDREKRRIMAASAPWTPARRIPRCAKPSIRQAPWTPRVPPPRGFPLSDAVFARRFRTPAAPRPELRT